MLKRLFLPLFLFLCLPVAFAEEISFEDMTFTSRVDQTPQHYYLILPEVFDPAQPTDLIIFLHGHGSDKTQILADAWEEIKQTRVKAAEYGAMIASLDYRAPTSWMGPVAELDTIQVLEELKATYSIRRVIFIGGSMGGSSSLTFAALHPELVDGVVAYNPLANHLTYENFQDAISESFGGDKKEKTMEYKNRSAEYFPERFTMPVAITVGGEDVTVPPDSARRLAKTIQFLQPNILLIDRPEAGHFTYGEDARTAIDFVFERL